MAVLQTNNNSKKKSSGKQKPFAASVIAMAVLLGISLSIGSLFLFVIGGMLIAIFFVASPNSAPQDKPLKYDTTKTNDPEELLARLKETQRQQQTENINYNGSAKMGELVFIADLDPLFEEVVRFVVKEQQGSTAEIQRRFEIGWNRTGRILDQMQLAGIVGGARGSVPRQVLIKDLRDLDITIKTNSRELVQTQEDEPPTKVNPREELNRLIGLSSVKEEVKTLMNYVTIQHMRERKGLKSASISYHCVFTGNPGTGKTTVARIIAEIYKEFGILKKGHLVETDRSGLVGEYVGTTAGKIQAIIDSAIDGVLFIDEAYSLVPENSSNDFGKEAIATLLKRMEDDRDRLVVILAGYTADMKRFVDSNPGLQSRFSKYIEFADYSADELYEIFALQAKNSDYALTPEAEIRLKAGISKSVAEKDTNFGNARFVRNLFEEIRKRQASRLASTNKSAEKDLTEIQEEDIPFEREAGTMSIIINESIEPVADSPLPKISRYYNPKKPVGTLHPNGKWVWKEYAPGKFDWRVIKK